MKRILTVLMLVFGLMSLSAQDVIVLRNADEIQAKVLQVGIDDIIYKKLMYIYIIFLTISAAPII